MKTRGIGAVAAAANGITCSSTTNATPIVATLGANHGLKNGDRISISGITGNTAANGQWTVSSVGATSATLDGSSGNGVHAGTAAVSVLCDQTPFMPRHSAVAAIGTTPGGAVLVGTVLVEGSDDDASFASALASGLIAIPAVTAGLGVALEVKLQRYMRLRASAFTSGGAQASLLA